jgi:hypothetical protein
MTKIIRRIIQSQPLFYVGVLAWTLSVGQVWGYQPPQSATPSASSRATVDLTCVICHSNPQPITGSNSIGLAQARIFLGQENSGGNEKIGSEELQSDIHARAVHKVWNKDGQLTNEFKSVLAKLKNQNAGKQDQAWATIDPETINDKEANPVFLRNCLTCHAGIQVDSQASPLSLGRPWEEFAGDRLSISSGSIGCEACHGRGSEYLTKHLAPDWLTYSSLKKQADGFKDLENSAVAAQVCLSCHLGSPSESKVVTHEMYAAGHPPLPPFDLAKFLDETCKKHWMDLNTKSASMAKGDGVPDERRIEYLRQHFQSSKDSSLSQMDQEIHEHFRKTQQSRVGQVMASLMSQDLMHFNAENQMLHGDYGVYDCVGCHQTLYKQVRGAHSIPDRVPGRPLGLMWTRPVASNLNSPALYQIAEFQKLLDRELNSTPFGSAENLKKAFGAFAQQRSSAKEQLIDFATARLDQRQAEVWLAQYLEERQGMMGNEWVGKQVFWSLEKFFDDLERTKSRNPNVKSRYTDYKNRFDELSKTAPPISFIVSCGQPALAGESASDYSEFFKGLRQFVEELSVGEAKSANQPSSQ